MESRGYPTDLSDDEWGYIGGPHLPRPKGRERPKIHGLRAILNAIFYVLKSGCPWRLLPKDFPPWKSVYDWFRKWRIDGTWERLNAALREVLRAPVWVETRSPALRHRGPAVRKDHRRRRRRAEGIRRRQEG
jgi:putative transposase